MGQGSCIIKADGALLARAWEACVYEMRIRPIEMIPMLWFEERNSTDVLVVGISDVHVMMLARKVD